MCQAAGHYFCGNFLGSFKDKHNSPPASEDSDADDADGEADRYMPKDHKKVVTDTKRKFLRLRHLKADAKLLSMGWGPHISRVRSGGKSVGTIDVAKKLLQISANRETISERMLENLSGEGRDSCLHTLELTNCHLKEFPPIGDLRALKAVKLTGNNISKLSSKTLQQETRVEWMLCDYNKLEAIQPNTLTHSIFPELKVLNFANNYLSFLPGDFALDCHKLRFLDLSSNKVKRLPTSVLTCRSLQLCFLQDNEMMELPADLHLLTELRKLFVSYNHLTLLPTSIGECLKLEKLQVSSNRITTMPDSIMKLWEQGSLEELRVDGNPLVQPGRDAFARGDLKLGFELFREWLEERNAMEALPPASSPPLTHMGSRLSLRNESEAQALAPVVYQSQKSPEPPNPSRRGSQQVVYTSQKSGDLGTASKGLTAFASQKSGDLSGFTSKGLQVQGQTLAVDLRLEGKQLEREAVKFYAENFDGDDPNARAEAKDAGRELVLDSLDVSDAEASLEAQRRKRDLGEASYYFEHLKDFSGREEPTKVAELRSAESRLLLLKKVKYLEGKKALARSKQQEVLSAHKEMPQHLEKFLNEDLNAESFKGKVPVTDIDLQFAILVYATKPKHNTCAELFQRHRTKGPSGALEDTLRRGTWEDVCQHAGVDISKEARQEIWELLAEEKEFITKIDFVAGWHIHDIEDKDPWIRRAAKVLKLTYYRMDLEELRARVKAKVANEADIESFSSSGMDSDEDSSEKSTDSSQESAVRPPHLEGERRRVPTTRKKTPAGVIPGQRRASMQALQKISLTEDELAKRKTDMVDEDSLEPQSSSSGTFPSEELSTSSSSQASTFSARSRLREMESEDEAVEAEKMEPVRMEIQGDSDIRKLMELSPEEILRRPPPKTHAEDHKFLPTVETRKRLRELHSKSIRPEQRFSTDVNTVRQALRQAKRNMTFDNFTTLLDFLLRTLKDIKNTPDPLDSICHADSPTFRHATGVDAINPYVRQLLEQIGFILVNDLYWVWPHRHVDSSKTSGGWGFTIIPKSCDGCEATRLDDMVELITSAQKYQVREKSKRS